jgi:PPP family 3-phenylpropionic acid transporter
MAVALVLVKFLSNPLVAIDYLVVLSLTTVVFATLVVQTAHSCKEKTNTDHTPVNLLRDWRLWLGFTLMQMSFGAFYNFFTIYETAHGISMDVTIYLWSFGVLIEIIMLYFQGKLLQGNLLNILQFTTFATVIRWMLVFLFADNLAMMFLAQSIHALSFALFHSAAISYLYHLYTNKPLAQQLFSGISYGLGGLIGAVVAGYMYDYLPQYLFLLSAILALGAFYCISSYAKTTNNP